MLTPTAPVLYIFVRKMDTQPWLTQLSPAEMDKAALAPCHEARGSRFTVHGSRFMVQPKPLMQLVMRGTSCNRY